MDRRALVKHPRKGTRGGGSAQYYNNRGVQTKSESESEGAHVKLGDFLHFNSLEDLVELLTTWKVAYWRWGTTGHVGVNFQVSDGGCAAQSHPSSRAEQPRSRRRCGLRTDELVITKERECEGMTACTASQRGSMKQVDHTRAHPFGTRHATCGGRTAEKAQIRSDIVAQTLQ